MIADPNVLSPEDSEYIQALARKYGLKSVYLDSKLLFNPNAVTPNTGPSGETCPECGGLLQHESGCATCYTCGFSLCH